MRVRVFLKQPFFTQPGYIPRAAVILEGVLEGEPGGGWKVAVDGWFDEKGARLEGDPRRVFIPMSKFDHAQYLD